MEFDYSKENIQPLAGGRDAKRLEVAVHAESDRSVQEELMKERREYEDLLKNYDGDDPLSPWFDYFCWIEQSYPSAGKESGLEEVLVKCLRKFENDDRYKQDSRLVKLFIKFIDTIPEPQEHFLELYKRGIGTMLADFYICWAFYYDMSGNFKRAEEIFRKGLQVKAQPYAELEQAHKNFGFTMSQRILYQDEESKHSSLNALYERRQALTSLRRNRKHVNSTRIGAAVKSALPGKVAVSTPTYDSASNLRVSVHSEENVDPNAIFIISNETDFSKSVVQSLIDVSRRKENVRQPELWSKAKTSSKNKAGIIPLNSRNLGFSIHEDAENLTPIGLYVKLSHAQLPSNHCIMNDAQPEWIVPLTVESDVHPNIIPCYDKFSLYPSDNSVFAPEERRAYLYCKRLSVNENFTNRYDKIWTNNVTSGTRIFPQFIKANVPQPEFLTKKFVDEPAVVEGKAIFSFNIKEIYPDSGNEEYQLEEIWSKKKPLHYKAKPDTTILIPYSMDETYCAGGQFETQIPKRIPSSCSQAEFRSTSAELLNVSIPPTFSENTSQKSRNQLSNLLINDNKKDKEESGRVALDNLDLLNFEKISYAKSTNENDSYSTNTNEPTAQANMLSENIVAKTAEKITHKYPSERKSQEHVIGKKFEIFEDSTDGRDQEAPKIVNTVMAKDAVIDYQDVGESVSMFANETCSTQTFNLFIKESAISTPNRKSQPAKEPINVMNINEQTSPLLAYSKANIFDHDPDEKQYTTTILTRKLSTIIETTETFNSSLSSGSGTTAILPKKSTGAIPKVQDLNVSKKKSLVLEQAPQEFSKVFDMPSMKIFEEKTDSKLPIITEDQIKETIKESVEVQHNENAGCNILLWEGSINAQFKQLLKDTSYHRCDMGRQINSRDINMYPSSTEINKFQNSPDIYKSIQLSQLKDLTFEDVENLNLSSCHDIPAALNMSNKANILQGDKLVIQDDNFDIQDDNFDIQGDDFDIQSDNVAEKQNNTLDVLGKDKKMSLNINDAVDNNNPNLEESKTEDTGYLEKSYYDVDDKLTLLNPFNNELRYTLMYNSKFFEQLENYSEYSGMNNSIRRLRKGDIIECKDDVINIVKDIREGGFGKLFSGKGRNTGKMYALKLEKPPNYWETYICMQIRSRITNNDILKTFMTLDYALYNLSCSILVSELGQYGTVIDAYNKIRQMTAKIFDEYIVMLIITQIFLIVDHLHAIKIIHADLKLDNLLLMSPFTQNSQIPFIKLIDMGEAIDMTLFSEDFNCAFACEPLNDPKCAEMIDNRPWTYQIDFFGIADCIHSLLFGKYMKVTKNSNNRWMISEHIPRYLDKSLWNTIFDQFLNIPDCKTFPNLQVLRSLLKERIDDKIKHVVDKIKTYNSILKT